MGKSTCTFPDCDLELRGPDLCNGHRQQRRKGLALTPLPQRPPRFASQVERFFFYVSRDADCWVWNAGRNQHGYGRFSPGGGEHSVYAHRWSYEHFSGQSIPPGLVVDHLCRNTSCVNPDHLEVVTQAENVRRGVKRTLHEGCIKRGHPWTPENTRFNRNGSRHCRACRRERETEAA